jgi:hypothetical protein
MAKKLLKYGAIGLLLGSFSGWILFGIGPLLGGILGALIGAAFGYRADVRSNLLDRINAIRSTLKSVLADPNKTVESKRLIEQWLKEKAQSNAEISKESIDVIFSIACGYVQRTPDLMEALLKSSKWSNLEQEIVFLLQKTALSYFENKEGMVINSYGVAGFLDDAYVAQYLIEKVAMWQAGMLTSAIEGSIDLHSGNKFVAALLPAKVIGALNSKVEAALNASQARQMLARMAQQSAALQENWKSVSGGIDFKKELVKDGIYSDLAKDGIYLRPTG